MEPYGIAHYLGLYAKGICMGIANIIPGVSGGTMAFILGIYEKLMVSAKSFDAKFFGMVCRGRLISAFAYVQGRFLSAVLLGILTATLGLSRVISWLLENQMSYTYAFFFGLILAAGIIIWRDLMRKDRLTYLLALASVLVSFRFVGLVPVSTPETNVLIFFSGMVAMAAMILPGISGAFILLLLGKYQLILEAINNRDLAVLGVFAVGAGAGVLAFARLIHWLLKHCYTQTMAVLTGLMLGSLRKLWPWKKTLLTMIEPSGEVVPVLERNILPSAWEYPVIMAVISMTAGLAVGLLLENWAKLKEKE